MKDLIEALTILLKYGDPYAPTHCEHDVLGIIGIEPSQISEEDKDRLDELGFSIGDPYGYGEDVIYSYRYGSA